MKLKTMILIIFGLTALGFARENPWTFAGVVSGSAALLWIAYKLDKAAGRF